MSQHIQEEWAVTPEQKINKKLEKASVQLVRLVDTQQRSDRTSGTITVNVSTVFLQKGREQAVNHLSTEDCNLLS